MANKYEDLLTLAKERQDVVGVPNIQPQNQVQGLLQMLASVAQNTGNPSTERGQIFQGAGNAYLGGLNNQNRQQFFGQVGQISQAQIDPAQKINMLIGLKAQHGTDYGLGLDEIAKQFTEMSKQNVDMRGQDVTMRGQKMTAANANRDREWKPKTQEEAMSFEGAKAGMKPPTQAMETTALYASRIKQADDIFAKMEDFTSKLGGWAVINSKTPDWLNFTKGEDYQSYEQAQRNFLNAVLRRESGAVISPTEFAEGRRQYFPQPGDKPKVLAQKKANRDLVKKSFIKGAGNAYSTYQETDTGAGGGADFSSLWS